MIRRLSSTSSPCLVRLRNNSCVAVRTHRVISVPTNSPNRHIPLTVVDWHLQREQLPFGYFFNETLDETLLEDSLSRALAHFPQTGGVINTNRGSIQCGDTDTVQLSFGRVNRTLEEWNNKSRGHFHQSGKKPELLPIFDALFEHQPFNLACDEQDCQALLKIRITYFDGGGTAIGVNFSHLLGDTSTCFHLVRTWGRLMRQKTLKDHAYCDNRANATVGGMLTQDVVEMMTPPVAGSEKNQGSSLSEYLPQSIQQFWSGKDIPQESIEAPTDHEYVQLHFSKNLLNVMKTAGMENSKPGSFVSTNDMITAFGWLLKRKLADRPTHSISMVVNLRGKFDVHKRMFGNGLAHVVAKLPKSLAMTIDVTDVCSAANSIRDALQADVLKFPDRLLDSRRGCPTSSENCGLPSFSTTSWGQFPLWKIRFGAENMAHFHGQPSHPLPIGRTFSSVILSDGQGGYVYDLLLPSDKASEAQALHDGLAQLFLAKGEFSR